MKGKAAAQRPVGRLLGGLRKDGLNLGAWKDKREQIREWVTRRSGPSAGTDGVWGDKREAAASWRATGFLPFRWDLSSHPRD